MLAGLGPSIVFLIPTLTIFSFKMRQIRSSVRVFFVRGAGDSSQQPPCKMGPSTSCVEYHVSQLHAVVCLLFR